MIYQLVTFFSNYALLDFEKYTIKNKIAAVKKSLKMT